MKLLNFYNDSKDLEILRKKMQERRHLAVSDFKEQGLNKISSVQFVNETYGKILDLNEYEIVMFRIKKYTDCIVDAINRYPKYMGEIHIFLREQDEEYQAETERIGKNIHNPYIEVIYDVENPLDAISQDLRIIDIFKKTPENSRPDGRKYIEVLIGAEESPYILCIYDGSVNANMAENNIRKCGVFESILYCSGHKEGKKPLILYGDYEKCDITGYKHIKMYLTEKEPDMPKPCSEKQKSKIVLEEARKNTEKIREIEEKILECFRNKRNVPKNILMRKKELVVSGEMWNIVKALNIDLVLQKEIEYRRVNSEMIPHDLGYVFLSFLFLEIKQKLEYICIYLDKVLPYVTKVKKMLRMSCPLFIKDIEAKVHGDENNSKDMLGWKYIDYMVSENYIGPEMEVNILQFYMSQNVRRFYQMVYGTEDIGEIYGIKHKLVCEPYVEYTPLILEGKHIKCSVNVETVDSIFKKKKLLYGNENEYSTAPLDGRKNSISMRIIKNTHIGFFCHCCVGEVSMKRIIEEWTIEPGTKKKKRNCKDPASEKSYIHDVELIRNVGGTKIYYYRGSICINNILFPTVSIKPENMQYTEEEVYYLEFLHRKIPDGLRKPCKKQYLYIFGENNLGVIAGKMFVNSQCFRRNGKECKIKYGGEIVLGDQERKWIQYYQLIFFSLQKHIYTAGKDVYPKYYYYVVPLDRSGKIDFEFLSHGYNGEKSIPGKNGEKRPVYIFERYENILRYECDTRGCEKIRNNLIWSETNQTFVEYVGSLDMELNTPIEGMEMSVGEYFETINMKKLNKDCQCISQTGGERSKVFECRIDMYRRDTVQRVIEAKEFSHVTPYKKNMLKQMETVCSEFWDFERLALAQELIEKYDLHIEPSQLLEAITPPLDSAMENYERLEFVGDIFLKLFVTINLVQQNYPTGVVVKIKGIRFSNRNLANVFNKEGLFQYVSFVGRNAKMFQAPTVSPEFFENIFIAAPNPFRSSNLREYFSSLADTNTLVDSKMRSDIIEAIIGAIGLYSGFREAVRFLNRLGILERSPWNLEEESLVFEDLYEENKGASIIKYEYLGTLPVETIGKIEKYIGYKFKHKGLVEAAFVHPSYPGFRGSSEMFQVLELVGDSALDLVVSFEIFSDGSKKTPKELNAAKKTYVSNQTYRSCIQNSPLDGFCMCGANIPRTSKIYSDIFEALSGAILVDLEYDYDLFIKITRKSIFKVVEKNRIGMYSN